MAAWTSSPPTRDDRRLSVSRPPHWWRSGAFLNAIIVVALFLVAFLTYFHGDKTTAFHPDESRWLNRAHYIEDILDPFGPTWNDQYLTRGQPPVGSYIMGIGLVLQGRDLDTNRAWDFRRYNGYNVANGMYPDEGDMQAGRRTNNFLGALAVVVVFFVVTKLTNRAGGILAALLLVANPLQSWHNRLALADTTLSLTLALILLCSILLVRRPRWRWALAVGILVGLGGANKLTPLSLCAPLALLGAIFLVRAWFDARRLESPSTMGWLGFPRLNHLGWMLLSTPITALATFVLVYPYLWPDPIRRTLNLLDFRTAEMENQSRTQPQFSISGPREAIERTWTLLGGRWSGTQEFLRTIDLADLGRQFAALDLWLAVLGAIVLLYLAVRKGLQSPHLIVLMLLATETATIILSMKTDFERYYLPIVLGIVVASGCAVGFGFDLVRSATAPWGIGPRLRSALPKFTPRQIRMASEKS